MDPDICYAWEQRNRAAPPQSCLRIDVHSDRVEARSTWAGTAVPRTPAPALTPEQVATADRAARAILGASPGELVARTAGGVTVYTRPSPASGRVV